MTTWQRANTDWFRAAKWGVITHFLADAASNRDAVVLSVEDWNRRIDSVDVERLAEQIANTGAGYHFLTLGQNSGFFCSPNDTYDRIVGKPSRLSERDLLGELGAALLKRGVRPMAYLPSHPPALHREAIEAMKYTPHWDYSRTGIIPGMYLSPPKIDDRLSEGLRNWEAVIREWSNRWGEMVGGWWFDGCYYADKLYNHADAPNFRSFAEAAKSGNPSSLVAFNPGVKMPIISMTEYEDYTAGELNDLFVGNKWHKMQPFVNGAMLQVLTYLGEWWGEGPQRFSDEVAIGYTRHVIQHGGVVTWDVPITHNGEIPQPFIEQLTAIGRSVI